jgi:hypothetical protein
MESSVVQKTSDYVDLPTVESIPQFLTLFDQIEEEYEQKVDDVYFKQFLNQLQDQTKECNTLLLEVSFFTKKIKKMIQCRGCNFRLTQRSRRLMNWQISTVLSTLKRHHLIRLAKI